MMPEKSAGGGLRWVMHELLSKLEHIRLMVQNDADLADAVTVLFELRGMLLAIPLPSAALLAEEMQRCCEGISNHSLAAAAQTLEAVNLALIQLPDYLERVDAGDADDALHLLPAINDLRACRGVALANAAELLVPASVLAQGETISEESMARLVRLARRIRPHFHRYLVRWFNSDEPLEGLLGLGRLFNHLRRYFKDGALHELFLASEGVIEGLVESTIPADPPTKALIARFDRLLKPLVAYPPHWPEEIASALLTDLLARLSQAPPGSVILQELENVYTRRLADDAGTGEGPAGSDCLPLIEAIRKDLTPIITQIQRFGESVAAESDTLPALAGLPNRLRVLAEPLPVLGLEPLAQRIERCAAAIEAVSSNPSQGHRRVDDIAHALSQVELKLRAASNDAAAGAGSNAQHRDLTGATLREAHSEIKAVCETLDPETSPTPDREQLGTCYETLAGLPEALRMAGESGLSLVIEDLADQIDLRYLQTDQMPGAAGLELMNRALIGCNVHLEDRLTRGEVDARMLEEARNAVERLTGLLPADEAATVDSGGSEPIEPVSESSRALNLEFLNLFIDEARDELDNINEQLRRFRDDASDLVALTSLRSSLYSLKGSGSLVGARQLAGLARSAGAVADALLDGALPGDEETIAFLTETTAQLPTVIDAESQRQPVPIDRLIRRGETLLLGMRPRSAPAGIPTATAASTLSPVPARAFDSDHPPLAEATQAIAQAYAAAEPDDVDDDDLDDLLGDDADVVQVFVEEAQGLVEALEGHLRDWRGGGFSDTAAVGAKRALHTLKGSARMAELVAIADLAHALETLLGALHGAAIAASPDLIDLVQEALDSLAGQIADAENGRAMALADALVARLEAGAQIAGEAEAAATTAESPAVDAPTRPRDPQQPAKPQSGSEPADAPSAAVSMPPPSSSSSPLTQSAPTAPAAPAAESTDRADDTGPAATGRQFPAGMATPRRFSPDWLDQTLNLAGEIGAYCERLSQQTTRIGLGLDAVGDVVARLRGELDQCPLDWGAGSASDLTESTLTAVAEGLGDINSLRGQLDQVRRDHSDLLRQQARIAANLLDALQRSRMVPFGQVGSRLQRLVRQAASATGKQVLLHIAGDAVELDRHVLEHLVAPLEHLLRNAVVHGIEPAPIREAAGKGPIGIIRIQVERAGNAITLAVTDDGAGMDLTKIRTQAQERGMLNADTGLSDQALIDLTLQPGFTTIDEVTQWAGRGVGLDVVYSEVLGLHGTLKLFTDLGQGTRIMIRLPMTLSLAESLLLSANGTLYAVPHGTALAVARVARDQFHADEAATVEFRGEDYQLLSLAQALEPGTQPKLPQRPWLPVLLVAAGERRAAFQVDALIGSERVMLKPIGPPLGSIRWLSGGTVLADGRVALVLDLPMLLRTATAGAVAGVSAPLDTTRRRCVMIVDDSHTVRRITTRLLARHDMDVITARDGTDALSLLHRHTPDLLLLDVEMPRMDGLELTGRLRESSEWQHLPIIMITSRNDAEHRQRAAALGVDRFLSKPFQEAGLIAEIENVLMERAH